MVLAIATFAMAKHHRALVRQKTAQLMRPSPDAPAELNRIRDELADMDLTKTQLAQELDARMQYLQSLEGEQFYLAIDTTRKKLYLRIGRQVAREADVTIGDARTITTPGGKSWTFVPLKGGFNALGKEEHFAWQLPEWLYVLRGEPVPPSRPFVTDALGRYVIFLPNGYVIHTPPSPDSPLQGAKPGSFMISEADMSAIWPRISKETRVYVF